MPTKDQLHALIDLLPAAEVSAAGRFLQFLADQAVDDSLNEDDWRAVRAGQAEFAKGEFTTLEDVKRELNL